MEINFGLGFGCVADIESPSEFTRYHLNSAKLFARFALNIEKENSTEDVAENIKLDHGSFVSSAIITAVAALEANINSLFVDFQKFYNPSIIDKNTKAIKDTIDCFLGDNLFDKIRDYPVNTISKYSTYRMLKIQQDINPSDKQDLIFIINVRNKFIHFTPAWKSQSAPKGQAKVEQTFLNKFARNFPPSPFLTPSSHVFPYQFLSAAFANFCVTRIASFIKEFNQLTIVKI